MSHRSRKPRPIIVPWAEVTDHLSAVNDYAWICPLCGGFGGWSCRTRQDARIQGQEHISRCPRTSEHPWVPPHTGSPEKPTQRL